MTPDRYLHELHRREERQANALIDLIVLILGAIVFIVWKACA